MSRGFTKEEDQEEIPFVPPRAHLPSNITNYVTQVGMDELLAERDSLINERDQLDIGHENERRIAINYINARLQLLDERISTAKIVNLNKQPKDEVRFGAFITVKMGADPIPQQYQIVGVDEADISTGKISFISPVARALINKKIGDKAILKLPTEDKILEVMEIKY